MTKVESLRLALSAIAASLVLTSAASAVSTTGRTFISGLGNDANSSSNCPRNNPCRTLAAAYTVTSAGGEIVALDGAGYGPITINHSITLLGTDGAAISVSSGTIGITISAGASDVVIVRNFQITGVGASNTIGISLTAGRLAVFNSTIRNLTTGLSVTSSKATLIDTDISFNGTGIVTTGTGVDSTTAPYTGTTWVVLERGSATFNTTAFFMHDPGNNLLTIFSHYTGSSINTFHVGNTTVMAGDGASCSGSCTQIGQYYEQVGYTFN